MVGEGDEAPQFALPDAAGEIVRLSDFKGRWLVLYFYPKDDTSGCTKEALGFDALSSEFKANKAEVAGVSPDSVASHEKFRGKHGLGVTLLADEKREAIEAYGVWAEKKMYGRTYMGVDRSTFLIGPGGRIAKAWRGVKVPGHAEAVLEAVKERSGRA
jgi:peroxiredoxin Q/BCP